MLEQLLNCPTHPEHKNYQYLPVSTSYEQELKTLSEKMVVQSKKKQIKEARSDDLKKVHITSKDQSTQEKAQEKDHCQKTESRQEMILEIYLLYLRTD